MVQWSQGPPTPQQVHACSRRHSSAAVLPESNVASSSGHCSITAACDPHTYLDIPILQNFALCNKTVTAEPSCRARGLISIFKRDPFIYFVPATEIRLFFFRSRRK